MGRLLGVDEAADVIAYAARALATPCLEPPFTPAAVG